MHPVIVVLMGVTGSGKTTLGRLLAHRLGCGFTDADDFHPAANIGKMRAGLPLTDEDRGPWLLALRAAIAAWQSRGESHVLACSALRQAYRDVLAPAGGVVFVLLSGASDLMAARLAARPGHYMNPALLGSQFATLEVPEGAMQPDISRSPDEIVAEILSKLPQYSKP